MPLSADAVAKLTAKYGSSYGGVTFSEVAAKPAATTPTSKPSISTPTGGSSSTRNIGSYGADGQRWSGTSWVTESVYRGMVDAGAFAKPTTPPSGYVGGSYNPVTGETTGGHPSQTDMSKNISPAVIAASEITNKVQYQDVGIPKLPSGINDIPIISTKVNTDAPFFDSSKQEFFNLKASTMNAVIKKQVENPPEGFEYKNVPIYSDDPKKIQFNKSVYQDSKSGSVFVDNQFIPSASMRAAGVNINDAQGKAFDDMYVVGKSQAEEFLNQPVKDKQFLDKYSITIIPTSDIFGQPSEPKKQQDVISKGLDILGGNIRAVGGFTEPLGFNIVDSINKYTKYSPALNPLSIAKREGAQAKASSDIFTEDRPYGAWSEASQYVGKKYVEPLIGSSGFNKGMSEAASVEYNKSSDILTKVFWLGSAAGSSMRETVVKDPGAFVVLFEQAVILRGGNLLELPATGIKSGGGLLTKTLGVGKNPLVAKSVGVVADWTVPVAFSTIIAGDVTKDEEGKWFKTTEPTRVARNIGPLVPQTLAFTGGYSAGGYKPTIDFKLKPSAPIEGTGRSSVITGDPYYSTDLIYPKPSAPIEGTGRAGGFIGDIYGKTPAGKYTGDSIYSTEMIYPKPKPIDGTGRAGGLIGDMGLSKTGKITGEPSYSIESIYPKPKPIDGTGRVGSSTGDIYGKGSTGLQIFDITNIAPRGATEFKPVKTYGTTRSGKSVEVFDMTNIVPEGYTPNTYGYSTTTVKGVSRPTITIPEDIIKGDWRSSKGGISFDETYSKGTNWRNDKGGLSIGETYSKADMDFKVKQIAKQKGYDTNIFIDDSKAVKFKVATPDTYTAPKSIQLPKVEYLNKPKPVTKPTEFKGGTGSGQILEMRPLETKQIKTLDLRPQYDLTQLDMKPKTKTIFKEAKVLELKTESEVKGRKQLNIKTENEFKMDTKQDLKTKQSIKTIVIPKTYGIQQLRIQDITKSKAKTAQRQELMFKPITELKVETKQRQETIFKPITVTKTTQRKETLFMPITEVVTKTKQRQETLFKPISATKTAQRQEILFKPMVDTVTKTTPKQITEVTPIVEPIVTPKTGGALFPIIPFGSTSSGGGSSAFGFKGKTRFTETYKVGEGTTMFSKSKTTKSKIRKLF